MTPDVALAMVDRMPAVVCTACGWWAYDVRPDSPRGGHHTPTECPECRRHHGVHRPPTPVWARFEPREVK
jgi:hypothetical protein